MYLCLLEEITFILFFIRNTNRYVAISISYVVWFVKVFLCQFLLALDSFKELNSQLFEFPLVLNLYCHNILL